MDDYSKPFDIINPESWILFSYAYLQEDGKIGILNFNLLQYQYEPEIPKYNGNCIYGILELIQFFFPDIDSRPEVIETMSKYVKYIQFLNIPREELIENGSINEETTQEDINDVLKRGFDFKALLRILRLFHLKELFVFDLSCCEYGTNDMSRVRQLDRYIEDLPVHIAKGKKTRKRKRKGKRKGKSKRNQRFHTWKK